MSGIPGTNVAAMVVPFDDLDVYATHNDKYGRGGFRVCDTLVDRNAIPELRRKEGMWVKVIEDGKTYEMGTDLLTWAEVSLGGGTELVLEAGEDLTTGTPVKVTANKFYAASHVTDPLVVGVIKADVLTGLSATAVTGGKVTMAGLVAATPYFLEVGALIATPPSSGYLIRVGSAISATTLLVEIAAPILLS